MLALAALASCRASEAAPSSGLTAPPGWSSLPSLATAARDAAKDGKLTIENVEAWGDTARGCYAAWMALAGGAKSRSALADDIVLGIEKEPALAGIVVTDIVKGPNLEPDTLSLTFDLNSASLRDAARSSKAGPFDRKPYRGTLHTQLSKDGHVALLACFWNEREPAACAASCKALAVSMK
jgi:hypothetical protein